MIVPMKKAKLIFMEESKEVVLKTLQTHALIMPDSKHQKQATVSVELVSTSKAIESIEKYLKKKSFGSNEVVSKEQFDEINVETLKLVEEINNQTYKYKELELKKEETLKGLNVISPYKNLGVSTLQLSSLKYLTGYVGKLNKEKKDALIGFLQNFDAYYEIINEDEVYAYLSMVILKEDKEKLELGLDQVGFITEKLDIFEDLNFDVLNQLNENLNQIELELKTLDSYFESNINNLSSIKLLHDQLLAKESRTQVDFLETKNTIYIEGWMRSDEVELLEKLLKEKDVAFELELRDPVADELSPTALKNNAFVKPFESITNQFAIPNPKEIDPNPIMSIWYWIIFGIMVGDMGYGLAMILIFGGALKFLKLKGGIKDLAKVFLFTGFTGMIAGALFGSILGFDAPWPKLLDPINDPLPMLIISLAIGVVHILCALVLKLILALRAKDILGALADSVSWILILVGLPIFAVTLALSMDEGLKNLLTYVSIGLMGIGALLIVILNGREKTTIMGKAVSAFTGLYNSTAYLSDILSYSRILALALSSGVIAMTFNILGDMVWNSIPYIGFIFGLLVYIVGHVFNFIMGLLSAYVHAGRLQYLEFYGKFFEGGGYLYEPLQLQLKYVYKVNLQKDDK